jgi:hypothetical protein
MNLIVPHIGETQTCDDRFAGLAQFLGAPCKALLLDKETRDYAGYLCKALPDPNCCLLLNPRVIEQWTGGTLPPSLVTCLTSRFAHLLIHSVDASPFSSHLVRALSDNRLHAVQAIANSASEYEVSGNCKDICGVLSGVCFGPVNCPSDHVFALNSFDSSVRTPINIGGRPFMAVVKQNKTQMIFLASADVLDVNQEIGNNRPTEYFSQFVAPAMALRYIFGRECWHSTEHHGAIMIDDPLLRPRYGFLNFEFLLRVAKKFNFCVTIAFIPYNHRRNSRRIVEMFREYRDRLAICFHGNDHTREELASCDISRLNTTLDIAETRMSLHQEATGLHCHKVMVFPQEYFSVEAMKVLKAHNFCAATSSMSHPAHCSVPLTIGELARPAVFRYGGFPLFLRKYVSQIKKQDVAFNLFFGRPVLIVDHHDVFRHPETLLEVVSMVNSLAPDIRWSDLETTVARSILNRTTPDGSRHIQGYSESVKIVNDRNSLQRYSVQWNFGVSPSLESVRLSGAPYHSVQVDDTGVRVALELGPHQSKTLSLFHRNDYPRLGGKSLGFAWNAKAYVRRRLSEIRDNYISKNQRALHIAEMVRHRVMAGGV